MSQTLKRPSPLSIRLSDVERLALERRAGGVGLSTYVKSVVLSGDAPKVRAGAAPADRTLLAQLLATLGGSRLAANLELLARAAETGSLVADQETTARLRQACDDVRLMHNALMRGLGSKERAPSTHQVRAAAAFAAVAKSEESE